MALITESALKADLKANKLSNIYYFYGKDVAAVETYRQAVVSKAVKKGDETYNLHVFNGENFNIDEFSDACEALPMFADYVCCTVCDLNADSLYADTLNRLVKLTEDIPDTTVLMFFYTSVDVTDGKKYPTAKNKKLMDAAAKKGTVCNFGYKTPATLSKDIMAKVSKREASISKEAAVYLAELCGCDTMLIGNELDKLVSYSGKEEITKETVLLLCPRQIETTSFDLARAVMRHDRYSAMKLLNDLVLEKIDPISILYAVSGNMIDLYRAKLAMGSRRTASDVMADFGYSKNIGFRVDNAFRDINSFSLPHLRKCMKILADTDTAMKSLRTDSMTLLEEAVVKMLAD